MNDDLSRRLPDDFAAAVAALNGGELMFPAPFSLAASESLGLNTDAGDRAEGLFDGAVKTRELGFHLRVDQVLLGSPDGPRREVLDVVVHDVRQLVVLIGMLAQEATAIASRMPAGKDQP